MTYRTLAETWGAETRFTQHLADSIDELNLITTLVGLPRVTRAENEFSIPGGSIDVVGFNKKGEAVLFEHQDKGGRADQTHVSKTMTYPHQLVLLGYKVLGGILLCESVDAHYVEQFAKERKEYARRRYNGHKNLHIVKSQWTEQGQYEPQLFDPKDVIRVEESWPLIKFKDFVKVYAPTWSIMGEEARPGTTTLWFRDLTRGRHYIHLTKKAVKVGVHWDNPTSVEQAMVDQLGGRHSQKRSTVELRLELDTAEYQWWLLAEQLKQRIRQFV
jgi:hypothetical protein